jgi:hypothetical protein
MSSTVKTTEFNLKHTLELRKITPKSNFKLYTWNQQKLANLFQEDAMHQSGFFPSSSLSSISLFVSLFYSLSPSLPLSLSPSLPLSLPLTHAHTYVRAISTFQTLLSSHDDRERTFGLGLKNKV